MQKKPFKSIKHQSGQGMVEYAIMLILLITLVIGGIELAGATLASGKASDAAKASINHFADVNQKRLNAQENQQKYLRQIDLLNEGEVFVKAVDADDIALDSAIDFGTEIGSASFVAITDTDYQFDNYVKFLDFFSNQAISESDADLISAFLVFFDDGEANDLYFFDKYNKDTDSNKDDDEDNTTSDLVEIIASMDGKLDSDNDGDIDEDDADGDIDVDELIDALQKGDVKQKILNLTPTFDDDNGTLGAAAGTLDGDDRIVRFKALLLFEELELALLPLDPRVNLSQSIPLLGDHDPDIAAFVRPECNINDEDVEYDYGLPDVDEDGVPDRALVFVMTTQAGDVDVDADFPALYLFNPLPIQLDSCVGQDANRDNQSLISILVGGYGKIGDALYEPGLPKLNASFYGQYSRVCLNTNNEYVACGGPNAAEEILKPPGKTCFSDVASNTVDSCTDDEPPAETSGYYFWGQVNDAGNGQFSWSSEEDVMFRPTFQLLCNGGIDDDNNDLSDINNEACLDDTENIDTVSNLKTIRVNVRYRHVFESFLTFGMLQLATPELAQYFYDPSNLRAPTVTVGSGIAGSELGPKASGGNPTVKQFKDFRGCYEINLETNQSSSCN